MDQTFRHKWIKIINQSNEQKCRLFMKRLKQQPIDVPFNSKQKFVWKLLRTRLEYLAQENNLNKEIIRLPTAEPTDMNWQSEKYRDKSFVNYFKYKLKNICAKPKSRQ